MDEANTRHIFYLYQPIKNNDLSNCLLLTLLSILSMKSCCSAVLLSDTEQKLSIFSSKGRSKREIIISIISTGVLHLNSLALMLFSFYTSDTISTQLQDLKRKLNVLQRLTRKLFRFCFFIGTLVAYTIKSIIMSLWWFVGSKCAGIFFVIILLSFSSGYNTIFVWYFDLIQNIIVQTVLIILISLTYSIHEMFIFCFLIFSPRKPDGELLLLLWLLLLLTFSSVLSNAGVDEEVNLAEEKKKIVIIYLAN